MLVFKLSGSTGKVLWRVYTYGPVNRGIRFKNCAVDAIGDLVLLAEKDGFWTAKFKGSDGRILWSESYGQADTGYPVVPDSLWSDGGPDGLSFDHLGNVILTGVYGDGTSYNLRTIQYAGKDGTRLWHAGYDGPASGADKAYAVICDETGNVVVVGEVEVTSGQREVRGIQYAADTGAVLREIPAANARAYGPTKGPGGSL